MTTEATCEPPKRFAPLDSVRGNPHRAPPLKGIIFDVDGTLCKPQSYMFRQMRQVLSISSKTDILEHIYSLPTEQQPEAMAVIQEIESAAMVLQEPQPGLGDLMGYLETRGLRKALCTRNFDGPVNHLLQTYLPSVEFYPIVTREFRPPKPHPAGILHIAYSWGLEDGGNELIMVGDSLDDMAAGFAAGCATVLLVAEGNENSSLRDHPYTGRTISRLDDLIELLESGFVEIRSSVAQPRDVDN